MIHILDYETGEIKGWFTNEDIPDDIHKKSLENTLETFEFTTSGDHKYAEYLTGKNRLIIPDEDGSQLEFEIKEVVKTKSRSSKIRVLSSASYLNLKHAKVIRPTRLEGYTPSTIAGWTLDDTGWRVGVVESNATRTFDIENPTKPYAFLKRIANEFGLELRFRVEHDGNKITNRYVDLLKRVGEWRGREVEFGTDLDRIKRTEKTDNIVTALVGLGPEQSDGTRLEVVVKDEEALQRWGRRENGELKHLWDYYEPQSTRIDMTVEELEQYTRTELNKRINEVVTYEANIIDLENVPGLENKKIRFGDTIKIKDTKFNPPLYLEARVFEQERSVFRKSRKKIKLGDYTEYTEEEVQAIWKQLQQQIRQKITMEELRQETYDKFTIDQKDETVFEDGKAFAELQGQTAENNAKSHADTVASEAQSNAESYADTVSEQALIDAQNYAVAKEVYDNEMQQIANDLADKAGIEYVDGQLVDKANKADVYTIEEIDNRLLNYVGVTEYETDMNGVVQELDSHSTTLGQHETAIGLKADSTRVDNLEGTIEDHSSQLNIMADEINSKVDATYVDGVIADIEVGGRNYFSLNTFKSLSPESWVVSAYVYRFILEPNTEYTLSSNVPNYEGGTSKTNIYYNGSRTSESGVWEGRPLTKTTDENGEIYVAIPTGRIHTEELRNGTYWIKLEKGNKATDWSPAPEDVQGQIDDLNVTVSNHSSSITQLSTEIESKVESSVVNALEDRVTSNETTLTQHDSRINAKAESTTVDNIESRLSSAEVDIDGLESTITLKADVSTVNDLESRVSTAEVDINALESEIVLKAESSVVDAIEDRVTSAEITIDGLEGEVNFAFTEIDDINGKINNATTTIDGDGITVKDGSFYLEDNVSDVKYSIVPNSNLLKDHSFELLKPVGSPRDDGTFEIEANQDFWFKWRTTEGTPLLVTNLNTDLERQGIFGNQAVYVSWASYLTQAFEFSPGRTYTLSAYYLLGGLRDSATPQLRARLLDSNGNAKETWLKVFDPMYPDTPIKRHSLTFTVPSSADPENDIMVVDIRTNNLYMIVDGVQLVEGERPTVYQPEDSIWQLMNGTKGMDSIEHLYLNSLEVDSGGASIDGDLSMHYGGRTFASGHGTIYTTGIMAGRYRRDTYEDHLYIGAQDEVRITNRDGYNYGNTIWWRPIQASSFNSSSTVDQKRNIQEWEDNALDLINQTTIYRYQKVQDYEDGNNHYTVGFAIGEGYVPPPDIVLNKQGNAIEQYAQSSMNTKAIQELSTIVYDHDERINDLEIENQLLKERVRQLEEAS